MNLIVNVDSNWAISYRGKLLVSIPEDMKFFRSETTGKVVVLGRKTLDTFPGGQPLKNRTNIILTRNPNYQVKGAIICHSVEEVLEELKKDYVVGARARGVRERKILVGSVLKASMLTIVTLLSLSIGSLLGGTAIVESIFMWDGVGKMAVDAILTRDYPVIQVYVVWMAIIYVMVNLATDIIYHYLDPRIRLQENS